MYTDTGYACTRAGGESGGGGNVACSRGGGEDEEEEERRSGVTTADERLLFDVEPFAPTARAIAARVAELELLREPGERWMR